MPQGHPKNLFFSVFGLVVVSIFVVKGLLHLSLGFDAIPW